MRFGCYNIYPVFFVRIQFFFTAIARDGTHETRFAKKLQSMMNRFWGCNIKLVIVVVIGSSKVQLQQHYTQCRIERYQAARTSTPIYWRALLRAYTFLWQPVAASTNIILAIIHLSCLFDDVTSFTLSSTSAYPLADKVGTPACRPGRPLSVAEAELESRLSASQVPAWLELTQRSLASLRGRTCVGQAISGATWTMQTR